MKTLAPTERTAQDIRQVTDEICALLIAKNKSYGDSALNPVRILSRASAEEGLKVRIDDKLSRLAHGNGEFNEDTVLDLLGYLILLRIAQMRKDRGVL